MPKNKKKFISKKNSVTFHLVHRSQQDPLAADENAPQHVLLEQGKKEKNRQKNKDEEHTYGIFFDDEYDYLQHLKNSSEVEVSWERVDPQINIHVKNDSTSKAKTQIQLPSSVFASQVEEPVGLLNKAAPILGPRLELDPDVVAAMDDDFDFDNPDNILQDNFFELANQECSDDDAEGESCGEDEESDIDSDERQDDVHSLCQDFGDVETKSRFTDYSMSSSVMRRNEQLTLLDDRFEKMFEKTYEESEIGALDCEEIEGNVMTQDRMLIDLAEQFVKDSELEHLTKQRSQLGEYDSSEEEGEEELDRVLVDKEDEKWDCESILSTYSNLYNHPAKICEPKGPRKIRINNKTGIPVGELTGRGGPKLTAEALAQLSGGIDSQGPKSVISMVSELSVRPKNETTEDRRLRKQNLKVYRKERRIEKKANTTAFKEEKTRQEKVMINLKNNLQGVKIL